MRSLLGFVGHDASFIVERVCQPHAATPGALTSGPWHRSAVRPAQAWVALAAARLGWASKSRRMVVEAAGLDDASSKAAMARKRSSARPWLTR
jgi:hypothetical protein